MKNLSQKPFFTLWILGLDLLLAVGIAELWTRNFIPVKNICYVIDEIIGVRFCPNQRTYGYVEKGYQNILETNSLGFHDRDWKVEKEPGTLRIQVYGDSMIQGYCVPTSETIPSLLETYLREQEHPVKIEVANLAAGDDGTSPQILTYKKIGRNYDPDLVLLYFMQDFWDNLSQLHRRDYSPYHRLSANGELILIPPLPKGSPELWEQFKKASRLYRLLANKLLESKLYNDLKGLKDEVRHSFRRRVQPGKKEGKSFKELSREMCINESWPLTLQLIRYFRDQVETDGKKFVLVDGQEFSDGSVGTRYHNKDLETFCRQNGIAYIPAYTRYAEIRNSKDREKYLFLDNHMKVPGNRIMSRFLAEEIKKLIPSKTGQSKGEKS